MHLLVWTRNEGITDEEFKDGDIFQVYDDVWTPGEQETKKWLCVKMPDYPGWWPELTASEYQLSASNEPQIRRLRKYRLNYEPKLTPEELSLARDPDAHLDIISDRFELTDIVRKY